MAFQTKMNSMVTVHNFLLSFIKISSVKLSVHLKDCTFLCKTYDIKTHWIMLIHCHQVKQGKTRKEFPKFCDVVLYFLI